MDDNTSVVLNEDSNWFIQTMYEVGPEYGCYPNKSKSIILTGITGTSILPYLCDKYANTKLSSAISTYTDNGEETRGMTIVGIPFGLPSFVNEELHNFTTKLAMDIETLFTGFSNKQTLAHIYST
eukprot:10134161-Ditylum_brightwellii.AAC.1